MVQLSEKELSCLNDALSAEDLLIKKFQKLANETSDSTIKSRFTEIAAKHQGHFNELYAHLK